MGMGIYYNKLLEFDEFCIFSGNSSYQAMCNVIEVLSILTTLEDFLNFVDSNRLCKVNYESGIKINRHNLLKFLEFDNKVILYNIIDEYFTHLNSYKEIYKKFFCAVNRLEVNIIILNNIWSRIKNNIIYINKNLIYRMIVKSDIKFFNTLGYNTLIKMMISSPDINQEDANILLKYFLEILRNYEKE